MGYIASNNIDIYPSKRTGDQSTILKSRIFIQDNICNLNRDFSGKDISGTFVVNKVNSNEYTSSSSDSIVFYIYGYRFETTAGAIITAAGTTVYATITTAIDSTLQTEYLANDEDNSDSEYIGVVFTGGTIPSGADLTKNLQIFVNGIIPINSTQRLSIIDGGTI